MSALENHVVLLAGYAPPAIFLGTAGGIESISAAAQPGFHAPAVDDDILFCWIETNNTQPGTISTGGWNQLASSPQDGADTCLAVYWAKYSGSLSLPTVNDSGDHQVSYMVAYRGVLDSDDPIKATEGNVQAASTSVELPSLDVEQGNSTCLWFTGCGRDANSGQFGNLAVSQGDTWAVVGTSTEGFVAVNDFSRVSAIGAGGGVACWRMVKELPGPTGTVTVPLAVSVAKTVIGVVLR